MTKLQRNITSKLKKAVKALKEPNVEVWASPSRSNVVLINMGNLLNLSFSCSGNSKRNSKQNPKIGIDPRLQQILKSFEKTYPLFQFHGY